MSKSVHLQILDPRDRKLTIIKAKEREDKEAFGDFPGITGGGTSAGDLFGVPGLCDPPLCPERYVYGGNSCTSPEYPNYSIDNQYGPDIQDGSRTGRIFNYTQPSSPSCFDPLQWCVPFGVMQWGCRGLHSVRSITGSATILGDFDQDEQDGNSVAFVIEASTAGGAIGNVNMRWKSVSGTLYVAATAYAQSVPWTPAIGDRPQWQVTLDAETETISFSGNGISIVQTAEEIETELYLFGSEEIYFLLSYGSIYTPEEIIDKEWGTISVDITQSFSSTSADLRGLGASGILASGAVAGPVQFEATGGGTYKPPDGAGAAAIRDVWFDGVLAAPELHYTIASGEVIPAQPLVYGTRVTARYQVE